MLVDRIEWAENKTLPEEVEVNIEVEKYHDILNYLEKEYGDKVKAFRYRDSGLLNYVRVR